MVPAQTHVETTVTKRQFNVCLPPDFIRRAKYRALDDQVSLSELTQAALEHHLEQKGPK
jgi:predicted HicB family RNase H-like nuclease